MFDLRSIRDFELQNRGPKNDPFSEGARGRRVRGDPPGGVRGGSKMAIFGLSLGVRNCANFGAKISNFRTRGACYAGRVNFDPFWGIRRRHCGAVSNPCVLHKGVLVSVSRIL